MENNKQEGGLEMPVRFPGTLSLRDLITVVSVAVSLTIAWGVFGTRITLIEKDLAVHHDQDERALKELDGLKQRVDIIQQRQYDNENMIDRLYDKTDIPPAKRRTPY